MAFHRPSTLHHHNKKGHTKGGYTHQGLRPACWRHTDQPLTMSNSSVHFSQITEPELLDVVDDAWLQDKLPDDSEWHTGVLLLLP